MLSQDVCAHHCRLLRLARCLVLQPRALGPARSWTPTLLGASALGDPRAGGSACVERVPSSIGPVSYTHLTLPTIC
eukprot:10820577-Alexandrium_andersonii.AAC.1